jgi:Mn2+/Fe2+ NRAMP family transporter
MRLATIIYHLAVSCWLGGAALFTFVLTPTLFKSYSRDIAGGIVGILFPGYFQWGLVCGVIALLCLLLTRGRQIMVSGILLAIMLILTATQAFIIEPRAAELKRQIPSFETTPSDHPLRVRFSKLHVISAAANLAVIGGGIILVILTAPAPPKKGKFLSP